MPPFKALIFKDYGVFIANTTIIVEDAAINCVNQPFFSLVETLNRREEWYICKPWLLNSVGSGLARPHLSCISGT